MENTGRTVRRRNSKIDFVLLFSWQTRDTALTLLTVAVSRQSKLGTLCKVLQVNYIASLRWVLANFWAFQLIFTEFTFDQIVPHFHGSSYTVT